MTIGLFHLRRQHDLDGRSASEWLHSFIDFLYVFYIYPLPRLISCILKHIYHYLYQTDRDGKCTFNWGNQLLGGKGGRRIESHTNFVTMLTLRYHFLSFLLFSFFFAVM